MVVQPERNNKVIQFLLLPSKKSAIWLNFPPTLLKNLRMTPMQLTLSIMELCQMTSWLHIQIMPINLKKKILKFYSIKKFHLRLLKSLRNAELKLLSTVLKKLKPSKWNFITCSRIVSKKTKLSSCKKSKISTLKSPSLSFKESHNKKSLKTTTSWLQLTKSESSKL